MAREILGTVTSLSTSGFGFDGSLAWVRRLSSSGDRDDARFRVWLCYPAAMDDQDPHPGGLDWRIIFGLTVTTVWIGGGLIYLTSVVGWENFLELPTADIGSFFEGAFAPLAFLWLVIGHFMQQKEITANTRAMSMQERTTRRLELHSRRDSYFNLLNLVQDQLGNIAAFHFVSVFGPTGDESVSLEEFAEMRSKASQGDHSLFIRQMIGEVVDRRDDPEAVEEVLFGTETRQRHSDNFCQTFERLLAAADSVDENNMVRDALMEGSAAGYFYRIIRYAGGDESMNPISGQRVGEALESGPSA
jgi:hypothetical protein